MVPVWKEVPFLRILPPFITGILLQWHEGLSLPFISGSVILLFFTLAIWLKATPAVRFRHSWISGALVSSIALFTGALIVNLKHPEHSRSWIKHHYNDSAIVKVILTEAPVRKGNYSKCTGNTVIIYTNDSVITVSGKLQVRFDRDVNITSLTHGSVILIQQPFTPVKNSGNPGAFNFERYCIFNGIAFQVFLKQGDFEILPQKETRGIGPVIYLWQQKVLSILQKYIPGQGELALAEALLIGYKEDLEKDLSQSYSSTGVMHVIAVSGMHLGVIYWMLALLLKPISRSGHLKWLSLIMILAALWIFSLMAGAGPSVIRSAVMFSFIATGETFLRRNNILNNLCGSAFLLLCWNPFWLWDIGFQLSYAAVLSIVVYYRQFYLLLDFTNKLVDNTWKLIAVTLAAQVLTTPFTIYHFHQFPLLFLPANIIAVPVSTIALTGELFLCAISWYEDGAFVLGRGLSSMIRWLNNYIVHLDSIPAGSWQYLQISMLQTILLFAAIAAVSYSAVSYAVANSAAANSVPISYAMVNYAGVNPNNTLRSATRTLIAGMCLIIAFFICRSISFSEAQGQRMVIFYHYPRRTAIDFIEGRHFVFAGHAQIRSDHNGVNFHLTPSRTKHRITERDSLPSLIRKGSFFFFGGRSILLLEKPVFISSTPVDINVLVLGSLSGRRGKYLTTYLVSLLESIRPTLVITTSAFPVSHTDLMTDLCVSKGIQYHSVSHSGALIYTLE